MLLNPANVTSGDTPSGFLSITCVSTPGPRVLRTCSQCLMYAARETTPPPHPHPAPQIFDGGVEDNPESEFGKVWWLVALRQPLQMVRPVRQTLVPHPWG